MSGKLAGRGAVVTGAGRGIGKAIVERLTAEGARVAALDMDEDAARASGAELGLKCDVTDSADVARCIRAARAARSTARAKAPSGCFTNATIKRAAERPPGQGLDGGYRNR